MKRPRIKFWSQRSDVDCAPVAILNALRWLGYDVSFRKHYKQLCIECGQDKTGTKHSAIGKLLKTVDGLKVTRPRKMTISRFENFLNGRKTAIVFSFRVGRGIGHCCLVVKMHGQLSFVNMCHDELSIADADLNKLFKHSIGFPSFWFLEKV